MELFANSLYSYKYLNRSHQLHTKILNDEKNDATMKKQTVQEIISYLSNQFFELELVKSEIEHKQLTIVSFFISQYAKISVLELC